MVKPPAVASAPTNETSGLLRTSWLLELRTFWPLVLRYEPLYPYESFMNITRRVDPLRTVTGSMKYRSSSWPHVAKERVKLWSWSGE